MWAHAIKWNVSFVSHVRQMLMTFAALYQKYWVLSSIMQTFNVKHSNFLWRDPVVQQFGLYAANQWNIYILRAAREPLLHLWARPLQNSRLQPFLGTVWLNFITRCTGVTCKYCRPFLKKKSLYITWNTRRVQGRERLEGTAHDTFPLQRILLHSNAGCMRTKCV